MLTLLTGSLCSEGTSGSPTPSTCCQPPEAAFGRQPQCPPGALTRISHFVNNSPFYQVPWKSLLYKTIWAESRVGGQDPYLPPSQRYPPDYSVSGAQFENHWPSRCWDQRKLDAYKHLEFAFLRQPCTASSALGALQDRALVRSSVGPMGKNLIPKPQKN